MATTREAFDVVRVRGRFPALRRAVSFLDGPGGSQVPRDVIDAMAAYLEERNANLGGAFAASCESDAVMSAGRQAAADFVGAEPAEIAFGANMTTLNFLLAHAVARTLAPGDEIVTTVLDHDANVSPWLLVARDHGLVVRRVDVRTQDCTLHAADVQRELSERTRIVAFTLASNAVGSIPDAARIARLAHEAGALAWTDAVHYAPHRRIDVRALGVDVLLCSPYKFCGPHLGIAYGRRDLLERLPADRVRPAAEEPPGHRFETGTQSHEAVAGTVAAIDYLASLGEGDDRRARLDDAYARIRRHEEALSARFLHAAAELAGLRLYGIGDPARVGERTPTFAFTLAGRDPRALAAALAAQRIAVWDGNYYALELMQRLGLEGRGGAVRAGFLHYTEADEVDRLVDALRRIAADR